MRGARRKKGRRKVLARETQVRAWHTDGSTGVQRRRLQVPKSRTRALEEHEAHVRRSCPLERVAKTVGIGGVLMMSSAATRPLPEARARAFVRPRRTTVRASLEQGGALTKGQGGDTLFLGLVVVDPCRSRWCTLRARNSGGRQT